MRAVGPFEGSVGVPVMKIRTVMVSRRSCSSNMCWRHKSSPRTSQEELQGTTPCQLIKSSTHSSRINGGTFSENLRLPLFTLLIHSIIRDEKCRDTYQFLIADWVNSGGGRQCEEESQGCLHSSFAKLLIVLDLVPPPFAWHHHNNKVRSRLKVTTPETTARFFCKVSPPPSTIFIREKY